MNTLITLTILNALFGSAHTTIVTIDTSQRIAEVEDYFLSYALDASILRSKLWKDFDIRSPKLHLLLKTIKPSLLRFGGTSADYTIFANDITSQGHLDAAGSLPPKDAFTKGDLDNMMYLIKATGGKLLYDLDLQLRYGTHEWDPTNALNMMEYIAENNYSANVAFELGNEPDIYTRVGLDPISAQQVGKDYLMLAKMVRSFPNFNSSMLVGPDTASLSSLSAEDIMSVLNNAGHYLRAVTFHQYYFRGNTANVSDYINPSHFVSLEHSIKTMKGIVSNTSVPSIPIWLGETSDAYDGGTANVSDRYVSGFLWLDKLGVSARNGIGVVVRQTLYGGNYALLDDNLDPNPDYWLTAFHKLFVGNKVLAVNTSTTMATTRVYAHCSSTGKGSVTLFTLNVNKTTSDMLTIDQFKGKMASAYFLTAPDNNLLSKYMMLNFKQVLKLTNDTELPPLKPEIIAAHNITLLPLSFGFFIIDTEAQACIM